MEGKKKNIGSGRYDDSVSYLQIVARHRADPRNYKPLDDSRADRRRERRSRAIRLCLAERSSLMSRRQRRSSTRTLSAAHHGSIPINKAVNAARVD